MEVLSYKECVSDDDGFDLRLYLRLVVSHSANGDEDESLSPAIESFGILSCLLWECSKVI